MKNDFSSWHKKVEKDYKALRKSIINLAILFHLPPREIRAMDLLDFIEITNEMNEQRTVIARKEDIDFVRRLKYKRMRLR